MSVRMRIPPLPIIRLFPFAGLAPIVVFLVVLLQVFVPMWVFVGRPLMCLAIVILGNCRKWNQQADTQCGGC